LFCADSSCWVPYLAEESGTDVELIDAHLSNQSLVMCPMVLTELFSQPSLSDKVKKALLVIPMLDLKPEFWERAGKTRASLIKWKCKPKLADSFIAQVCIDHNIPLHARDTDFRPFAKYAGLQLVLHGQVN
jgi:predicted nucleic acid-binding protein